MAPSCELKHFEQEETFIVTSADTQILQHNISSATSQSTHQKGTAQTRRANHVWQDPTTLLMLTEGITAILNAVHSSIPGLSNFNQIVINF
jgi:hypothetical protein